MENGRGYTAKISYNMVNYRKKEEKSQTKNYLDRWNSWYGERIMAYGRKLDEGNWGQKKLEKIKWVQGDVKTLYNLL